MRADVLVLQYFNGNSSNHLLGPRSLEAQGVPRLAGSVARASERGFLAGDKERRRATHSAGALTTHIVHLPSAHC